MSSLRGSNAESEGMGSYLFSAATYLLIGMLWGCTNPFIKKAQGNTIHNKVVQPTEGGKGIRLMLKAYMEPLYRLVTEYNTLIPYAINQCGSLLFLYLLSSEPVSQAVPIVNSLTFIFTAIVGYFFCGEKIGSPILLLIGVLLVLVGTYVCLIS